MSKTKTVRLVDPEFASEYLRTPTATLADWRHRRVGPRFVMVSGRRPKYDIVDLDRFIEDQKVETSPLSEYRRMRGDVCLTEARGDHSTSDRPRREQRRTRR